MKGFYWETDESVHMETILYYIVSNFSEENTLWSLTGLDRLEQYYAKLNDRIFNREQMMENIHMIGENNFNNLESISSKRIFCFTPI